MSFMYVVKGRAKVRREVAFETEEIVRAWKVRGVSNVIVVQMSMMEWLTLFVGWRPWGSSVGKDFSPCISAWKQTPQLLPTTVLW